MTVEQLTVRKVGNSLGLTLPAKLAKRLRLVSGQALDAHLDNGKLILSLPTKPRYALADLVAQCNPKAAMPADLQAWETAPAVGRERL